MSDKVKVKYTPNGPGIGREKEVAIEELSSLSGDWQIAHEDREKVEELQEEESSRSGLKTGNHGIAASNSRMEKWNLTEEELGHTSEEEEEDSKVVEEALDSSEEEAESIEELWAAAYQNEREERGYGSTYDSKEEKVKSITQGMGNGAWEDPEDPIDELAEELIDRIDEGDTTEELDNPTQSSREQTEELSEDSDTVPVEAKREAARAFKDRGGAWADIGEEIEEELQNSVPNTSVEELPNGRTRLTTKHQETREECQALLDREDSMHRISDENGVMVVEFEDTSVIQKYI